MKLLNILFILPLFFIHSFGLELSLNKEQKEYLKNKKSLNLCTDKDFMPFSRFENGRYEGIGSDIYKIIQKRTDLDINIIPLSKSELKEPKKHNCDVIDFISTVQTQKGMELTKSIINTPLVLVTNMDAPFIDNLTSLKNKNIALLDDQKLIGKISKKYPMLNLIKIDSADTALDLVKRGKIYGYIDSLDLISYRLRKDEHKRLKVSSKLKESLSLSSAVLNNDQILFNIISKVLESIGSSEIENIKNRWLDFEDDKNIDYELLIQLAFIVILVSIFMLQRQYELNKLNKRLEEQIKTELEISRKKDNLIFQQNKMASLGEMVGNIAHQWRQPLSEITMSHNILLFQIQNGSLDKETLSKELKESQKLLKYMSNTIDTFEKLYGKSNKTRSKDIFVKDLLKEVEYILKEPIKLGTIKLIQKIDPSIMIKNDNNSLIQVFLAILQNSIYFFKERNISEPKIFISIKKHKNDICITIGDNAKGIDEEILPRIFDYNFSGRKENNKSTGVGLYISKLIIEEVFRGTIYAENRNNGIRFIIDLPA